MNLLKLANPVTVTKGAFGLAGTAVGLAETITRETAHVVLWSLHQLREAAEQGTGTEPTTAAADTATGTAAGTAPDTRGTVVEDVPPGPTVAPVEPHAPAEPPVDVVGEALAAEAAREEGQGPEGAGLAHEPRGASREEEHGDTGLQRAEVEEIAEEAAAALEGDVEPEEHLTAPLLDPADTKAVAAELQTMSRAADPDKS